MNKSDISKTVEDYIQAIEYQYFQDFCDRLLIKLYNDYTPVRAGGSHGDMKNDGYCFINRIFFQAHASRGEAAKKIKTKIENDLKDCLEKQRDVQVFIYLTNDTLTGEVERFIDELRTQHSLQIESWGYKRLAEKISNITNSEDVEYIIDRKLWSYQSITYNEEQDFGIIDAIFEHIFKEVIRINTTQQQEKDLTKVLEKIKLNFSKGNQKNIRRLFSDLWQRKGLVEQFVKQQITIDESEITSLTIFIGQRFLEIRQVKDIHARVEDDTVFEKIAVTMIPDKHKTNPKYIVTENSTDFLNGKKRCKFTFKKEHNG